MEPKTSAQLRADAEAATSRATQLAERRSTVDQEIEEVREAIKGARLAAARAGTSPSDAAADLKLELEGLLQEREDLPEIHHAAREDAASLGIAAESALVREVTPQVQQAQTELAPLIVAAAQAADARDRQAAHLSELQGVVSVARTRARRHEELLQSIESEGVKPLH